MNTIFT